MDILKKLERFIYGGTKQEAIAMYKRAENYYREGNISSAKFYWLKSARCGNPYAMYKIGLCHYYGLRGKVNYEKAVKSWEFAAESGHLESKYCIGVCLLNGWGVKKNTAEAVKIFQELRRSKHSRGTYQLGICYRYGLGGLLPNIEKADYYSLLACKTGYDPAHDDIIEKI